MEYEGKGGGAEEARYALHTDASLLGMCVPSYPYLAFHC